MFGAAAIKVSWKFVGGKASFDSTLLTHLYSFSVFILITIISDLVIDGLFRNMLPDVYDASVKSMKDTDTTKSLFEAYRLGKNQNYVIDERTVAFSIISFLIIFESFIWVITTWGAYRDLNSASRARSFVAFIISCFLFMLVFAMLATIN